MIGSKILVDAIGYSQLFLDLLGGKITAQGAGLRNWVLRVFRV